MSTIEKFGDLLRQDDALTAMQRLQQLGGSPALALVPFVSEDGKPQWDVAHLMRTCEQSYGDTVIGRGGTPAEAIEDAFGRLKVAEIVQAAHKEFTERSSNG